MNIATIKLEIIRLISDLQNENVLKWLLKILKNKQVNLPAAPPPSPNISEEEKELGALHEMAKQPISTSIDLEELKKEQGYDPKSLSNTLKNWDYSFFEEDSLEDMLNALSK